MRFLDRWRINFFSMKTILQKKILFAAWHVTYQCNLRCKFCNFYNRSSGELLTPEQIGEAHKKLIPLGVKVLNFAGGEPFIRKDLPEIISAVSPKANIIVNTNGTLINTQIAKACWQAGMDVINISVDFASPHKHDFYRNKAGAWEKAFNAIDILAAQRTNKRQIVTVQSIYSPQNHYEFEELIRLCEDRNITFATNPYNPGAGHQVEGWQLLADREGAELAKAMSNKLFQLKKKYPKTFIISDYALKNTAHFFQEGFVSDCCAGRYMLAITPSGEILPCERQEKKSIGNIQNLDPKIIEKRLLSLSNNLHCSGCYARERSELEYIYQPLNLKQIAYLLSEAKT